MAQAEAAQATTGRQALSTDRLGTQSVGKLLLEFSIPAVVMMVFNALYNVVDSIFLGQAVGETGIAVATLAFPIMILVMGLSALVGQGGNALAAIYLGEDRVHDVERTLGNTVLLLFVAAAIVFVMGSVFIDPILRLVGTTDDLYDQTKLFCQIIMLLNVFQCVGMGANNFLRTEGKPNLALLTAVMGTIVCIILNYLFVMRLGMGVAGSATATVVGQAVGMVPVMWYLMFAKSAPFRLKLSCMKPDFKLWGKILSLGLASFIMQVANAVINTILNQLLAYYGAMDPVGASGALAAIGVAGRVNSFAFMPAIGVCMGAQTIIGYNYGARLWRRVKKTFWLGVLGASSIIIFFFVLIHIIPVPIVNLFGVTGDLESFCVFALQVMTAMFPIVGFQIMGSNYFQSTGQPLKATVLSLTRQILFLIPLLLILPLVLPGLIGITSLEAIPFTYPTADVLSAALTLGFIIPEMRKLTKRAKTEQPLRADLVAAGAGASSPQGTDGNTDGKAAADGGSHAAAGADEAAETVAAADSAQADATAPAQESQEAKRS